MFANKDTVGTLPAEDCSGKENLNVQESPAIRRAPRHEEPL